MKIIIAAIAAMSVLLLAGCGHQSADLTIGQVEDSIKPVVRDSVYSKFGETITDLRLRCQPGAEQSDGSVTGIRCQLGVTAYNNTYDSAYNGQIPVNDSLTVDLDSDGCWTATVNRPVWEYYSNPMTGCVGS